MTKFPSGWDITYTKNHWANEEITIQYISNVLLPYVERKMHELHLSSEYPALVIYDKFKAQCTDSVIKVLQDNKIHILMVLPSCTDRLQPLDVSVNKAVKEFLCTKFQKWYGNNVMVPFSKQSQRCFRISFSLKCKSDGLQELVIAVAAAIAKMPVVGCCILLLHWCQ